MSQLQDLNLKRFNLKLETQFTQLRIYVWKLFFSRSNDNIDALIKWNNGVWILNHLLLSLVCCMSKYTFEMQKTQIAKSSYGEFDRWKFIEMWFGGNQWLLSAVPDTAKGPLPELWVILNSHWGSTEFRF